DAHETIEGAPLLKATDLPVFDCAFKPSKGERSIHWLGHLKMMGATQPFLSGAISKTVNLPTAATVEDIEQAYLEAWKLGLKAVAVYRDGCKRSQPLNTSRSSKEDVVAVQVLEPRPLRRRLPDERKALTHKFSIGGHEGYLTVGMYEDGTPGELFCVMAKEGSVVSGLMDSFATAVSLALQYGVPLQVLIDKFSHTRFEPSGFTGNAEIPIAKSITDYIFRWLALKFGSTQPELPEASTVPDAAAPAAPSCTEAALAISATTAAPPAAAASAGPACCPVPFRPRADAPGARGACFLTPYVKPFRAGHPPRSAPPGGGTGGEKPGGGGTGVGAPGGG